MCGIYCKLYKSKNIKKNVRYENKTALLSHRGPDFQQVIYHKNVVMGHTRLAILDTRIFAAQPYKNKKAMLVFNGEIYNYRALAKKYLAGIELKTTSDTEVLFELLNRMGTQAIAKLDGMFAFAYMNFETDEIIIARDISGIKPLYYIETNETIEIASEIKSLDATISREKLRDQIRVGAFQDTNLPYQNVAVLEGGTLLTYSPRQGKLESRCFANPLFFIDNNIFQHRKQQSLSSLVDELETLVINNVKSHLVSDAPLATLCSGGVDSSLISAIAAQHTQLDLYHAGVEGGGGEEEYAEIVSAHLGKNIIYEKMTANKYWAAFPYLTYISDLPIYHPNDISLHCIASRAHTDGIKVMLSGEGADELFGGYSWHQRQMKQYRLARIFASKKSLLTRLSGDYAKTLRSGFEQFTLKDITNYMPLGLGYFDISNDLIMRSFLFESQDFANWKRLSLIHEKYNNLTTSEFEKHMLSAIHFNFYGHLGNILHRTDRILMANSIEGRVPFLTKDIIDFSMNIPLNLKIHRRFRKDGKYLLKKLAERYLPNSVIYRPKAGFPVPIHEYVQPIERIFENGYVMEFTGMSLRMLKDFYAANPLLKFRLLALEVYGRIFVWHEDYRHIHIE
ncbi:TPA: asparagine synthase (glutamine-hydrolyzing) [Aeromonas dhakensis]|nr:asparagine synthase (glutamine-hydrolyzing) [Aeromonas dhakensis]